MKVSVITVAYNSEKTIKDTIESVFAQTYPHIEYIIVDGFSSDSTLEIIKEFEEKFMNDGKVFKYISEKDNGIYDAINKGIKMTTGDIVGILNSDDFYYDNNVVEDIIDQFNTKAPDCLYGDMIYINPTSRKVVRRWISREFKSGLFEKSWTPGHPTFYCKKEFYDKFGLYRTDFKIAADVELMYRFIEKKFLKSLYFNRYIVTMRQGGVSTSGIKSTYIITKEMRQAFKDNGGKFNLLKYLGYKALKVKEFMHI